MRATSVIVRFLSLLDVTLILLGVLMVTLMHAEMHRERGKQKSSTQEVAELADVEFIYLYAGWNGAENGRCYLYTNGKKGPEISQTNPNAIQQVIEESKKRKGSVNYVVLLLFADDGWFAAWDAKKLAQLEETWKVKIVPVYNARLTRRNQR
ncbi:MAG: hypothetical protein RMJ88_16685 [Thermogemmata sp.]|nr:hypothetical protein [Thermogemmata sp.]